MRKMVWFVIALFVFPAFRVCAATYNVTRLNLNHGDPDGGDTIAHFLKYHATNSGDIVRLYTNGDFVIGSTLVLSNGVTLTRTSTYPEAWITASSALDDSTMIRMGNGSSLISIKADACREARVIVDASGKTNVTINNCIFGYTKNDYPSDPPSSSGCGVIQLQNTSYANVINTSISGAGYPKSPSNPNWSGKRMGIQARYADHLTVTNCGIGYTLSSGISLSGSSHATILRNTITQSGLHMMYGNDGGDQDGITGSATTDLLIEGNTINEWWRHGIVASGETIHIIDNDIYDQTGTAEGSAIYLGDSDGSPETSHVYIRKNRLEETNCGNTKVVRLRSIKYFNGAEFDFGATSGLSNTLYGTTTVLDLIRHVSVPPVNIIDYLPFEEFNKSIGAWSTRNSSSISIGNNTLGGTSTTTDPQVYVNDLDSLMCGDVINCADFDYVAVNMRVEPGATGNAQVFWGTTAAAGFSSGRAASSALPLYQDDEYHTCIFPVYTNANWNGTLHDLRIDPFSTSGKRWTINWVRLLDFGYSDLAYWGLNGEPLVYNTYANQGQANSVNTLPDFSRCGYKGGGVTIPFVPAVVTVNGGPGDDTLRIQNAINAVSALPVQANGFRGAVLMTAGTLSVSNTLVITNSGIVLRGEGSQTDSSGTLIIFTATNQDNLIEVKGCGDPVETAGTRVTITDSYVPVGAKSFHVSSAAGYSAGNRIRIQNKMNQTWIDDLGMAEYGWTPGSYQLYFDRIVTSVSGNTIYIDAPVVQAIETRYGGGDIFKYTLPGRIENVGIESLYLRSNYSGDSDTNHGWNAVYMGCVENAWVRQVTARYFGYSCVNIGAYGHFITIEDCAQLDPKSPTTGGFKYSFNLDDCSCVLLQRCFTRGGRHDYVSSSQTPGPNAFVDCLATNTHADIGPHHRYSTGQIYDNIKGGEMDVQNRRTSGTGHGWSGAQILFWNCNASSIICDAPPGAMNWSIGCKGTYGTEYYPPAEPDGIWDSHGAPVLPRSLYYAQLEERLGEDALQNVILPSQQDGTIWTQLGEWAGNGLFGYNVISWCDSPVTVSVAANVRGIIRNLKMLEDNASTGWSKLSGPGTVTFGNASAKETTAIFSQEGTYVLQFWANGAGIQAWTTMTVIVSP